MSWAYCQEAAKMANIRLSFLAAFMGFVRDVAERFSGLDFVFLNFLHLWLNRGELTGRAYGARLENDAINCFISRTEKGSTYVYK